MKWIFLTLLPVIFACNDARRPIKLDKGPTRAEALHELRKRKTIVSFKPFWDTLDYFKVLMWYEPEVIAKGIHSDLPDQEMYRFDFEFIRNGRDTIQTQGYAFFVAGTDSIFTTTLVDEHPDFRLP